MSESEAEHDALEKFVDNVVTNLAKHGFPERVVAFPIERLYDSAYAKGLNFNKVLEALEARGITHEKTPEKVIFRAAEPAEVSAGLGPFAGMDFGAFAGGSMEEQMAAAAELVKRMTPDQLAAIRGIVEGLSDAEKADLLERARAASDDTTTH